MNFCELLNTSISAAVQRGLIDVVCAEYGHTHTEVKRRFLLEEAQDVEPHIRRANIESALLELAARFPDDVTIKTGVTQKKHHYRYLVCGRLVLTQSYVEPNRRVPREAVFRNGFADDPNQMLLDPQAEAERLAALEAQELTYVIITHCPSASNPGEPSHVSAVLVNKDCQHVASVDLIQNVATLTSQEVAIERIEDRRRVVLRKDVTAKREAGAQYK